MLKINHEQLIIRYFEEAWNRGYLDVLDEIISQDYLNHHPGIANPVRGPAGLKPIITEMRSAFPDLKYTIKNMVISETQVAVHTLMQGTHKGNFFGLAATNKKISVEQMQIERIVSHQIVEHWRVTDELHLLRQLGQISGKAK